MNYFFYHYVHYKITENFKQGSVVSCNDVCNFVAHNFRVPRKIKKKVLVDLDALGLVELIRGDKIIIKEPVKVLNI